MESLQAPWPMEFTKQNIGEQWKRFKQRFEIYKLASGAAEKAQDLQVSLLLHVMGEDALDIFNSFTFANDDEKKNYDVVIEKLITLQNTACPKQSMRLNNQIRLQV